MNITDHQRNGTYPGNHNLLTQKKWQFVEIAC